MPHNKDTQEHIPVIETVPQLSHPGTSREIDGTITATMQGDYTSTLAVPMSLMSPLPRAAVMDQKRRISKLHFLTFLDVYKRQLEYKILSPVHGTHSNVAISVPPKTPYLA